MQNHTPRRPSWSALNIWMHWLIAALIVVQILDHDAMEDAWRNALRGASEGESDALMVWLHIGVGFTIFVFALVRLADRLIRGRPPHPEDEPVWALWLAKSVHALLYLALILMPISGLVAWFGGVEGAGSAHSLIWTIMLVLIGVHILGALTQHFIFRTNVLTRMVRPDSAGSGQ
ncbi:cytochrome b [Consotaella salsifontis]|uniref:Cytochrome b561 n=1 Tax=Consotaella salsifontis TaxID=1365950 RepID=A0A1T4M9C1_9HYPH|nr:cytochrome b/b6 domain-containing protein [Consotaella salsifontis]SJZ63436.1 cytochrome b561 [Consotaella salsifontis]